MVTEGSDRKAAMVVSYRENYVKCIRIIRVVMNKAVHPGQFDLVTKRCTQLCICPLVLFIIYYTISSNW